MMRLRDVIVWLALAGCNPVFGIGETQLVDAPPPLDIDAPTPPDRDRDGIDDEMDSCITSIADAALDIEGDGASNDVDPCPFGYDDTDADGDLIGDECDPYPALDGDRRRCVMAFANPRLNRDLWAVRDGMAPWDLLSSNGITGSGTGSLVATTSLEGPVTTHYHVPMALAAMPVGSPVTLAVWARAGAVASPSDVGCVLRGDATGSTIEVTGGAPLALPAPIAQASEIQLTMQPSTTSGNNMRCRVKFLAGLDMSVAGTVTYAPGTFGVSIVNAWFKIYVLTIHERDDAPPL